MQSIILVSLAIISAAHGLVIPNGNINPRAVQPGSSATPIPNLAICQKDCSIPVGTKHVDPALETPPNDKSAHLATFQASTLATRDEKDRKDGMDDKSETERKIFLCPHPECNAFYHDQQSVDHHLRHTQHDYNVIGDNYHNSARRPSHLGELQRARPFPKNWRQYKPLRWSWIFWCFHHFFSSGWYIVDALSCFTWTTRSSFQCCYSCLSPFPPC